MKPWHYAKGIETAQNKSVIENKRALAALIDEQGIAETDIHLLKSRHQIQEYLFAGKATLTLENTATGNRFTLRITRAALRDNAPANALPTYFVGALTGSSNETDYRYLGCIKGSIYYPNHNKMAADAPSQKAATWFLRMLQDNKALPATLRVYHSGRCGRCGRLLTTPESILRGIGPECASKMTLH